MNLIEVVKAAGNKPFSRHKFAREDSTGGQFTVEDGVLKFYGDKVTYLSVPNLIADDWYVVEPKSAIERAIDAEFPSDGTVPNACFRASFRRIVNLALDEAKKAVSDKTGGYVRPSDAIDRIDALKVKI